MVWLRRWNDYSNDDRRTIQDMIRRKLIPSVDPQTGSYIESVFRHAQRSGLNKEDLRWLIQVPAIRDYPRIIQGLNRFVTDQELWISCSDDTPVAFVTVLERRSATIYKLSTSRHLPPIMSSVDVASHVEHDKYWDRILQKCEDDQAWASCLLEVLQWIRNHDSGDYRRLISRRQLQISKKISRIPPSMHLYGIQITHDLTGARSVDLGGGHMYLGTAGNQELAVKVIRVDNLYERLGVMKAILREIIPWSRLNHPNIVPFCGVTDDLPGFKGQIAVVSPWMKNGSIKSFLSRHPRFDKMICVKDIIAGLKELHSAQPPIFHRDLKSANILVDHQNVCCIADFGASSISGSQKVETTGNTNNGAEGGTLRWRPPEVIMPGQINSRDPLYASAADVWALGCVIYEIYTGLLPYNHYKADGAAMQANYLRHELPGQMPQGCPDVIRRFVQDCWQREPLFRPNLTDRGNSRRYPGLFD